MFRMILSNFFYATNFQNTFFLFFSQQGQKKVPRRVGIVKKLPRRIRRPRIPCVEQTFTFALDDPDEKLPFFFVPNKFYFCSKSSGTSKKSILGGCPFLRRGRGLSGAKVKRAKVFKIDRNFGIQEYMIWSLQDDQEFLYSQYIEDSFQNNKDF